MNSLTLIENKQQMNSALLPQTLDDLLFRKNVRPGFYVARGERSLTRLVMERVVWLLEREIKGTLSSKSVTSQIGQLFWVDSGNSFEPYYVAQQAAKHGVDPKRVLRAINVARPFTAFQFQQMLSKVPRSSVWFSSQDVFSPPQHPLSPLCGEGGRPASLASPASTASVSRCWPLVIVSDLMGLFYDAELPVRDSERAFKEFLIQLTALSQRAIVMAMMPHSDVPSHQAHLIPHVLRHAHLLHAPRFEWSESLPERRVANAGW